MDFSTASGSEVLLREVIGVISTVGVDVTQFEAVIAENAAIFLDAEGKVLEGYAVHLP